MPNPIEQERLLNKVRRFSIVITLRKLMPVVVGLGVVFLSVVLGVWNVRMVEYEKENLKYVDIGKLEEVLSGYKGENIFVVKESLVAQDLRTQVSFVKEVDVDKVIPYKVVFSIEEYNPKYAFVFNNKCNLYSEEGVKIYEVCEECDCSSSAIPYGSVYISSNILLENESRFMYSVETGNIINVLSEFGYIVTNIDISDGIIIMYTQDHRFIFDLNDNLSVQLSRMFLVGKKINMDSIQFESLDLRFERPVLKNS